MIPNDLHEATLHSWNVAFQRQLPFLLTADIAYVGNRGVDLVMDVDSNASLVYGIGQQRPAAVRDVQPHRHEPHPHEPEQVAVQRRCRSRSTAGSETGSC